MFSFLTLFCVMRLSNALSSSCPSLDVNDISSSSSSSEEEESSSSGNYSSDCITLFFLCSMKIFLVAFITSSLSTNALTTYPSFFIFFDALNMLPPSSLLTSSLSLSSSFRSASSSSICLMRSFAYSLSYSFFLDSAFFMKAIFEMEDALVACLEFFLAFCLAFLKSI